MERVSVNKGLLIGVVGVAATALLALVFVLGRESGSGVPAPQTRIERVAPRTPEQSPAPQPRVAGPITEQPGARPDSGPAPTPQGQGAAPLAGAGYVPAPTEIERGNARSDDARASVAAYFDAVDHIQAGAMNGEAETVAHEMAASLASGDTSGADKLIRETEAAKARLAAVTPPAPCAAHHRESLASLDDALDILRSLKAAMESSDPAAQLGVVIPRAQALRSRAGLLQKEELALRERYGLKR